MENGGNNKRAGTPGVDDELAKDVARLYSWANVEDVPYRDFSRLRKPQHKQPAPVGEGQKDEDLGSLCGVVEDSARAAESAEVDVRALPVIPPANPEKTLASVEASPQPAPVPTPQGEVLPHLLIPSKPRTRPKFVEQGLARNQVDARPVMAVYSLAGGVGRTTLCANLGRVLCSMGEQVLLVDASGSGLLPFYFGASDLRPGLRTFVAPGMNYSPLRVIGADEVTGEWLKRDVASAMMASQRAIFDLGPASTGVLPEIFQMCTVILIPLLPDLNSILSISRIEASVKTMQSKGNKVPSPFYLFNEFDEQNSMDQRARELVVQQCGERLLPFTIRHGAEVAVAIASRMTVADHAPESEVTHDYMELAVWLRKVAPASQTIRSSRWSEQ
jgi:cellulose synthase operon protein YhjQ